MTPSEALVLRLCQRSFFDLWSYPNPLNSKGKELCDVLVVFDPHIIVFSVKDIAIARPAGEIDELAVERWTRAAIDESAKQLHGAVRVLGAMDRVMPADGRSGLPLPPLDRRRVHRIAVALGSRDMVPIPSGHIPHQERGKSPYVHVFDEGALDALMGELDTISDFVKYLQDLEEFNVRARTVVLGGEQNLLAYYLLQGRTFPPDVDRLIVHDDWWTGMQSDPSFRARQDANRPSKFWDDLISFLAHGNNMLVPATDDSLAGEVALRVMAAEHRLARRVLAGKFLEGMNAPAPVSSVVVAQSGVMYVFVFVPRAVPRADRHKVLAAWCLIARSKRPEIQPVLGLATENPPGPGGSFALYFEDRTPWSAELAAEADRLSAALG